MLAESLAARDPHVTGGQAKRSGPDNSLQKIDFRTALPAVPAHVDRGNVSAVIRSIREHWPHVEGSTDCPSDSTLRRWLSK
jgi:hypothetical protein